MALEEAGLVMEKIGTVTKGRIGLLLQLMLIGCWAY